MQQPECVPVRCRQTAGQRLLSCAHSTPLASCRVALQACACPTPPYAAAVCFMNCRFSPRRPWLLPPHPCRSQCIDPADRRRIERLEIFDEFEEWHLIQVSMRPVA